MAQPQAQHKNRFYFKRTENIDFLSILGRAQIRGCQSLVAQKILPFCSS